MLYGQEIVKNGCAIAKFRYKQFVGHTFVEFVSVDDEKLSSGWDWSSATSQRASLGKLLQVAFGAVRLFLLHAGQRTN